MKICWGLKWNGNLKQESPMPLSLLHWIIHDGIGKMERWNASSWFLRQAFFFLCLNALIWTFMYVLWLYTGYTHIYFFSTGLCLFHIIYFAQLYDPIKASYVRSPLETNQTIWEVLTKSNLNLQRWCVIRSSSCLKPKYAVTKAAVNQ